MKLAVVGAGGVGGYFGGRWAEAGLDVTFLARGMQLDAIRESGLRIISPLGDAYLRPRAVRHAAEIREVDAVVVATKAWQLPEATAEIKPLIGEQTVVLGIQNGVEAADVLAAAVGPEHVLGASCRIISFVESPGVIRHVGAHPTLIFGERAGGSSPRVERLREVLAAASGMSTELSMDIQAEIWTKLLFLAPFAGVGSVSRSPIGVIRSDPELRRMLRSAMEEVHEVARARGVKLAPDAVDSAMAFVDGLPAEATSSMQRDFRDGKRTEIEALTGAVVRLAAGVEVEVNRFMYTVLNAAPHP